MEKTRLSTPLGVCVCGGVVRSSRLFWAIQASAPKQTHTRKLQVLCTHDRAQDRCRRVCFVQHTKPTHLVRHLCNPEPELPSLAPSCPSPRLCLAGGQWTLMLTLLYRKTPRMAVIMPSTLVLVTGLRSMMRDTVMTMILLVALATE